MKAIELTGSIDEQGQLLLDQPIKLEVSGKVRVIVLYTEPTEELEDDSDDTPIEEIKASLKRALQEAKAGQRISLDQMWEGINVE
ncbi:MAG TPA: hypothetical protein VK184_19620 [Nostocaceae cyanobacterium]|nr:hypothetical protein [Nostocaceae cyanobacterium]